MRIEPDTTKDVVTRLRRAGGQIQGVITMLETGRDCGEVVAQLAAVSRALDRAGFRLLAGQLRDCLSASASAEEHGADLERLEKLFLSLA